jgi:hypothetical protein
VLQWLKKKRQKKTTTKKQQQKQQLSLGLGTLRRRKPGAVGLSSKTATTKTLLLNTGLPLVRVTEAVDGEREFLLGPVPLFVRRFNIHLRFLKRKTSKRILI